MKLHAKRVVLTGAAGGIGRAIAGELVARGARVALVDVRPEALHTLTDELQGASGDVVPIIADLTSAEGRGQIQRRLQATLGGVDVLINNAGVMDFTEFRAQDPELIERTFKVNVLAPMQLTRELLPDMLARKSGAIVNIGSVFGSIAFGCFASYSASKFALRGFSEALRRELANSGVGVTYVAPRAVRTALNSSAVYRMAERVKMNMDDPQVVALGVIRAIEKDQQEVYLGFPESLFVRVNALWPRLVDGALRKQTAVMREFTHSL